jgi:phosphoenolpyruvate carboxykinase (GTP)
MRVLKWIIDRCEGRVGANESPIGHIPRMQDLDLDELGGVTPNQMRELLIVSAEEWQKEVSDHAKFFESLGGVVPDELEKQRKNLAGRFKS